jgi:Lrp/AsnC family transcriptional regulator, regulator for asnA, asnC and gidA
MWSAPSRIPQDYLVRVVENETSRQEPSLPLDDIDRRIIAALQVEGRRPWSRIAADLGVPENTVRYRAQRLEQARMLQVVGIADPLRLGFDRMALIGIKIRPGSLDEVCAAAAELPETSYVAAIAGAYDVIIEVVCRDTVHFTELLTKRLPRIDGVQSTESFFVLQIHKMAYGWGVAEVDVVADDTEKPSGESAA